MRRGAAGIALAIAVAFGGAGDATAQESKGLDKPLSDSTYNPLNRLSAGHFRVQDPKNLSPDEAEAIYLALRDEMRSRYARSRLPAALAYMDWTRYSSAPYKSVTHGRTYLHNYANDIARAYGRYEKAGTLPVGSVLAKDSFMVNAAGEILPGPLSLMEKMPAGFNPASGDWRYTHILPDGSVLGITNGENAEHVTYCVPCHQKAGAGRDHLFFPKRTARVRFD